MLISVISENHYIPEFSFFNGEIYKTFKKYTDFYEKIMENFCLFCYREKPNSRRLNMIVLNMLETPEFQIKCPIYFCTKKEMLPSKTFIKLQNNHFSSLAKTEEI